MLLITTKGKLTWYVWLTCYRIFWAQHSQSVRTWDRMIPAGGRSMFRELLKAHASALSSSMYLIDQRYLISSIYIQHLQRVAATIATLIVETVCVLIQIIEWHTERGIGVVEITSSCSGKYIWRGWSSNWYREGYKSLFILLLRVYHGVGYIIDLRSGCFSF